MIKRLLIAAGTSLVSLSAYTQTNDTLQLNEITVRDGRSPVKFKESLRSITVLTAEDLKSMPAMTVQEVLSYVHSVDIRQRGPGGAQADISIRGGTFDQCLVLIDGVKFSDPQTGHHMMNLPIQVQDIERIEVLRGSASRIFGQNGFSGAINIVTKKDFRKQLTAEISAGEYESGSLLLSASYLTRSGWGSRLTTSLSGSNGYQDNRDLRVYDLLYQGHYQTRRNSEFGFTGGMQQKAFGAQYFYTAPASKFREYEETRLFFGTLSGKFSRYANLHINLNWRRHDDEFRLWRDSLHKGVNTHLSDVYSLDANISGKSILGISSFGAELRREEIASSNLGRRYREIAGFFFEQRAPAHKTFSAVIGTNVSYISGYGWVAYPGAEMGARLNSFFRAYGSIGRSFRVPTFTDLYYTDAGPSSLGNPGLKPESAWTWEAGLKFDYGSWKANGTYFLRQAQSLIDWQKTAPADLTWYAVNVNGMATRGMEFEVLYQSSLPILQHIRLGYTALQSDPIETPAVSRYVYDYLRHQVSAGVRLKYGQRFIQQVQYRYLERIGYPLAHVLDSRVSYTSTTWSAWVQYENITGTTYFQLRNVPMPEHWLRVGLKVKLG